MENTVVDTRPFARLTEGRATNSWRSAIPAVVVVVAVVGLLGFLASKLSSSSQRAMAAERDTKETHEQMAGLTKQIGMLQKDNALAKSPGRTTVIVEPSDKKSADAATWAAVTWGELPDGKTFLRVNAYGLLDKREGGKDYHLWFQPQAGDPIDVGILEPDQNGSGFAMNSDLPALDQGKEVMLTTDATSSKQPGDVLAKTDLPKLTLSGQIAPPTAGSDLSQAKSGTTSQQMHQAQPAGKKPAAAPAPAEQQPGK